MTKRNKDEPYLKSTIRGPEWTTDREERVKAIAVLSLLLGLPLLFLVAVLLSSWLYS